MDKLGPLGIGASLTILEGGDNPAAASAVAGSGQTAGGGLFAGLLRTEIRILEEPGSPSPAPLAGGSDALDTAGLAEAEAGSPVPAGIGSALAPATTPPDDDGGEQEDDQDAETSLQPAAGPVVQVKTEDGPETKKQEGAPATTDQGSKVPETQVENQGVPADGKETAVIAKATVTVDEEPAAEPATRLHLAARPLQVHDVLDARARQLIRAQQAGQDGARPYLRPAGFVPARPETVEPQALPGHTTHPGSAKAAATLTGGMATVDPAPTGPQAVTATGGTAGPAAGEPGPLPAPNQPGRSGMAAGSLQTAGKSGSEGAPREVPEKVVPADPSLEAAIKSVETKATDSPLAATYRRDPLQGEGKAETGNGADAAKAVKPGPDAPQVTEEATPEPGEEAPAIAEASDAEVLRVEPDRATQGAEAAAHPLAGVNRSRPSGHVPATPTPLAAENETSSAAGKSAPAGEAATAGGALRSSVLQQVLEKADPSLNAQKVTIELRPEHLGRVEIEFRGENDRLEVRIQASTPAAAQALSENLKELTDAIKDKGARYQAVDIRVEVRETPEPRAADQNRDSDRREQARDQGRQDSQDRDQRKDNQEGRRQRRGGESRARWQQALREEY